MTLTRKNHTHKPYIVYNAGGYFLCDECGEEIYYTDLGLTWKDLIPYYEFYNDPTDSNYEDDRESIEFFKKREGEESKKTNVFERLSRKKQRLWIKNEYDWHKNNCKDFSESEIESGIRDSLFSSFNTHDVKRIKEKIHEVISA